MKLENDIALTPKQLADAFCRMNDEEQAQFFIEAAEIAKTWDGGMGSDWQWFSVGRHLPRCACSTDEARALVKSIAEGTAQ